MESKELDFDDFDMDEILTEFAEEEKKTAQLELSDGEDELDKLVEEFAVNQSDSEDEAKPGAKIILSSSDDEIDNLLDDFNDEDSSESTEPLQVTQDAKKDIGTYGENIQSILITDSNTVCDTVYDSAVEIFVSDESTPVKSPPTSNSVNPKINKFQLTSSSSAKNISNYSEKQENKICSLDNLRKTQQSDENFERNNKKETPKKGFSSVPYNDSAGISHKNSIYVPVTALPTNEKIDTLVKSFVELNSLEKDPSPVSIANVTVLCDQEIKSKNTATNTKLCMEKIIEHAIDQCMSSKLNNTKTIESSECQENSSEVLPIINNVAGSGCNIEGKLESCVSNCDSALPKNVNNATGNEAKSTSEDNAKIVKDAFSLTNLSIKSEDMVKPCHSNIVNKVLNNSVDVKKENCITTEKKPIHLSHDIVKSENCLSSEKNNYSFSKSLMNDDIGYQEQPKKIEVEIKIQISSEDNAKMRNILNESALPSPVKTESTQPKTANALVKFNGLKDKFLTGSESIDKSPVIELRKRKLETFDCEINLKKRKEEDASSIGKIQDITSLIFADVNEASEADLSKKLEVSKKGLDYLAFQTFQKFFTVNVKELSQAEEVIKNLEEASAKISQRLDLFSKYHQLRTHQKELWQKNSYIKPSIRTVGINVKILSAQEQKTVLAPSNSVLKKNIIKETEEQKTVLAPSNSVLKKNIIKETEVSNLKETKETASILQKVLSKNAQTAATEEKKTLANRTNSTASSNKQVSELPRTETSLIPYVPKTVPRTEEKAHPFVPNRISPPNRVMSGNRIIPYRNPTKPVPSPVVPMTKTRPSSQSVTNQESSIDDHFRKSLSNAVKLSHYNERSSAITPGTSVLHSVTSATLQHHYNESVQRGNSNKTLSLPQSQLVKIPESVTMSSNQLVELRSSVLQYVPSSRSEAPKEFVVLPFRTTTSSNVTPTVTINKGSYGIPTNHPVMRNIPSVSETLKNQIMQLPPITSSAIRPRYPALPSKSSTGIMKNNEQHLATFPYQQMSQAYTSQGPMVLVNSPPFTLYQSVAAIPSPMQQSNLQISNPPAQQFSNSPCYPYMNHLSPSMGYLPLPLQSSVAPVNPSFSDLQQPSVYSRVTSLTNQIIHNEIYSQTPTNEIYSQTPTNEIYSQTPTNEIYSQTPTNEIYSQIPTNEIYSQIPTNEIYSQIPTNEIYSQTPTNQIYSQTPINQFYSQTSTNQTSCPSASIQLQSFAARNVPNPSVPSSRVSYVLRPPPAMSSKFITPPATSSKFITPPPTPPVSQYVSSEPKIPPLPEAPSYSDIELPKPTLKVTKEETDVILSWNLDLTPGVTLHTYQIYSCHTNSKINQLEVLPIWKKMGDIQALKLPMACRLRQFEKHNSYHFIIRVVDVLRRLGPFSDCVTVHI